MFMLILTYYTLILSVRLTLKFTLTFNPFAPNFYFTKNHKFYRLNRQYEMLEETCGGCSISNPSTQISQKPLRINEQAIFR